MVEQLAHEAIVDHSEMGSPGRHSRREGWLLMRCIAFHKYSLFLFSEAQLIVICLNTAESLLYFAFGLSSRLDGHAQLHSGHARA